MRRCLTAVLALGLMSTSTRDAAAQPSVKDQMAYAALNATPIGALTPVLVSPGSKGEKSFNSFAGRFSHFAPETGDGNNSLGASFYHQAGMNAAVSGTLGYLSPGCAGCDGVMLIGGDVHSTLWNSTPAAGSTTAASVNLQGSLGFGTTNGANYLSAALGVPLAISMEQASKARLGAFLVPGFGFGRTAPDGFDAEAGTRPMIGFGASWTAPTGWGVHGSFQKVMIENGGNNLGVGFTWRMGAR